MKKCRNLSNKLIMSICALVVAVSAFFYVPMEVSAEESRSFSGSYSETEVSAISSDELLNFTGSIPSAPVNKWYYRFIGDDMGTFDFSDYYSLDDDLLYKVDIDFTGSVQTGTNVYSTPSLFTITNVSSNVVYSPLGYMRVLTSGSKSASFTLYFKGSDSLFTLNFNSAFYSETNSSIGVNFSADVQFSNFSVVNSGDSDEYQSGYDAGYEAGQESGYGSGYSDGYADGENSVDTGAIYDEAFQAGKDSVNTDSYYDAGYDAGYQIGVQESYEIGYEAGYESAMERVDSWGADSSDYPLLVHSFSSSVSGTFDGGSFGGSSEGIDSYTDLVVSNSFGSDFLINPNHTYRFDVLIDDLQFGYSQNRIVTSSMASFLTVGDFNYLLNSTYPYQLSDVDTSFFVPGSSMSNTFGFDFVYYSAVTHGLTMPEIYFNSYSILIYDVGPSGDTQNHIANQTDQLTNGFDSSTGDSVNSDFSAGLNDYQTAEDSLFATATTGMKDFTFFDFGSVPAMVTGMSFVGSVMSSWFNQAGGASGVGIVLSILFSVMLVAMVLGLYRWYQSRGGKK